MKLVFQKYKSIIFVSLFFAFLLFAYHLLLITPTFAACAQNDWKCVIGGVSDPTLIPGNSGDEQLSNFINRIIELIFIAAAVVFTFMIMFGAFQWITSSGDKEALTKARGRITHAIIGLVLLSLTFVIVNILGNLTGIGILKYSGFDAVTTPFQKKATPFDPAQVPVQPNAPAFSSPRVPIQNPAPTFEPHQIPSQAPAPPFDPVQGGTSQKPCCPTASRRLNNQCVDIGTNLPIPAQNPSAC